MLSNFRAARDGTAGPLVIWRAFDDLSSPDYIATLASRFERRPGTSLAVGQVRQVFGGTRRDQLLPCRADDAGKRLSIL